MTPRYFSHRTGFLIFLTFSIWLSPRGYAAENQSIPDFKQKIILANAPAKNIADQLGNSPVIYIGEYHTEYGNHVKQLEIIQSVFQNKKNIAIGMEMFTKKVNPVIADYLSGKITETEFLKKSEYFTEWGYDYHYYKIIIDFAKKNNIDVIGLNIKNEIVQKIGRAGFKNITDEEMSEIPGQIDFSMEDYKKSLREVFYQHSDHQAKVQDNFYLSQFIRDEYMAKSAALYLKSNPKKTLIILAGSGHVEYGYGIPKRLQRQTGTAYKSILLDSPYKPEAADFFVYTSKIKLQTSPRLKVILNTEKIITVTGFFDAEVAKRHVLKEKDQILAMNDIPLQSIGDIRLFLYDKLPGNVIDISIIRDNQPMRLKYTLEAEDYQE